MATKVLAGAYSEYAFQRIIQKLDDLVRSHPHLSFSEIAAQITAWKRREFYREYFGRLRKFTLSDPLVDIIVDWIVEFHDSDLRSKLTPDAIFQEVGHSSRDFYFHLHERDDYDAWEEDVLMAFAGIYICAPAEDRNTYLPVSALRRFFADYKSAPPEAQLKRALDVKQYINERSILILRATRTGYYHAAEFPMSLLLPPSFVTLDMKMVHEGIGIASGNSIRVFFRECLSRVGRSHSIIIHPKGRIEAANPRDISINVAGHVRGEVRDDWMKLDDADLRHLRDEFAETIAPDHHFKGVVQFEVSPLPNVKNRVEMTFSRECVYHRKPADFLRHPELHFIRPDIENTVEVERIVANPLAVGSLL